MASKRKNRSAIKISIIVVGLLLLAILLDGCARGMTPIGWSGVNISNGTAYTGSKEGTLVAVNLSNGSKVFASPLKAPSTGAACASGSSGSACGGAAPAIAIYGTPALVNNVPVAVDNQGKPVNGTAVVLAGYNGKIIAYQSNNLQNEIWEFPQDNTYLAPIISAVTVSGTNLYFGDSDGSIYALNLAQKQQLWSFPTGGEVWGTPLVDNNLVIAGSFSKKIYAVDATTGKEVWEFATKANNVSTPIALNGVVYYGSLDRNMYAINETTGQEIWHYTANNWFWAKPIAINGIIYAPNLDGNVYALDAQTGKLVASYNVQGQVSSWPVLVKNSVVVATENGKLWSIDTTNPTAGPKMVASIVQGVSAPLSAEGDVVYINGPDNNIYGYNIATGAVLQTISLASQ